MDSERDSILDKMILDRICERFTERSRKVMLLANEEAKRLNHPLIGTVHILLGLVIEGEGVAGYVLKNVGVDLCTLRREVDAIVQSGAAWVKMENLPRTSCDLAILSGILGGAARVTMESLPRTPAASKLIECSMEEARGLQHNYVGTEHLLLGLLRVEESAATLALTNCGLVLTDVRTEILNLLGHFS